MTDAEGPETHVFVTDGPSINPHLKGADVLLYAVGERCEVVGIDPTNHSKIIVLIRAGGFRIRRSVPPDHIHWIQ